MDGSKVFFLSAMPRSGNTLFASVMNQNPDLVVTANSITLEIMKDLFLLKQTDVFQNFPDHHSLNNVLDMVYRAFYKNWSYKYIIDRGPVALPGNLALMKKHFKQPIKCIVLLRDLMDVLASYIKWFETEPSSFINKQGRTIEEKLSQIMNDKGAVAKELKCIQHLMRPENKHMAYFFKYDHFVIDPEKYIKEIYQFLEIPYFQHQFIDLDQLIINGTHYNDSVMGKNMHTIRTKEIKKLHNPYKEMIPERIKQKYGHIKF
jgi:sulfotransferase